ncbi:Hypothetical_protein [Hexamita inflata]|uniref:Hypothetical_protein n=1 Tax=Hexamita inflata TaxID=28002 RepID=A0AA86Q750_9EUKA|nr:Hypothetical protein HINF_LOCUS40153 [Hexamita inflata]
MSDIAQKLRDDVSNILVMYSSYSINMSQIQHYFANDGSNRDEITNKHSLELIEKLNNYRKSQQLTPTNFCIYIQEAIQHSSLIGDNLIDRNTSQANLLKYNSFNQSSPQVSHLDDKAKTIIELQQQLKDLKELYQSKQLEYTAQVDLLKQQIQELQKMSSEQLNSLSQMTLSQKETEIQNQQLKLQLITQQQEAESQTKQLQCHLDEKLKEVGIYQEQIKQFRQQLQEFNNLKSETRKLQESYNNLSIQQTRTQQELYQVNIELKQKANMISIKDEKITKIATQQCPTNFESPAQMQQWKLAQQVQENLFQIGNLQLDLRHARAENESLRETIVIKEQKIDRVASYVSDTQKLLEAKQHQLTTVQDQLQAAELQFTDKKAAYIQQVCQLQTDNQSLSLSVQDLQKQLKTHLQIEKSLQSQLQIELRLLDESNKKALTLQNQSFTQQLNANLTQITYLNQEIIQIREKMLKQASELKLQENETLQRERLIFQLKENFNKEIQTIQNQNAQKLKLQNEMNQKMAQTQNKLFQKTTNIKEVQQKTEELADAKHLIQELEKNLGVKNVQINQYINQRKELEDKMFKMGVENESLKSKISSIQNTDEILVVNNQLKLQLQQQTLMVQQLTTKLEAMTEQNTLKTQQVAERDIWIKQLQTLKPENQIQQIENFKKDQKQKEGIIRHLKEQLEEAEIYNQFITRAKTERQVIRGPLKAIK